MIDTNFEREMEKHTRLRELGVERWWTFPPLCGMCACAGRVVCLHYEEVAHLQEGARAKEREALLWESLR